MDDNSYDSLENIVTLRQKLKKKGNSKQAPSSTKNVMEVKAEM